MNQGFLLIDIQKGFLDAKWGTRNNPNAEERMSVLLTAARRAKVKVYHVKHMSLEPDSPLRPGHPGNEFMDFAIPCLGERVFEKKVNSGFIGTCLEQVLRSDDIKALTIVGFTTDHCVSTTARMAANLGFKVFVVNDATATFERTGPNGHSYEAQLMHETALASLHREFVTVIDSDCALAFS